MYESSSSVTGHFGLHDERATTSAGTGPIRAEKRADFGGGRKSTVAKRRFRRIGGVGLTSPMPLGPSGRTLVPNQAGLSVTHRFGSATSTADGVGVGCVSARVSSGAERMASAGSTDAVPGAGSHAAPKRAAATAAPTSTRGISVTLIDPTRYGAVSFVSTAAASIAH